MTLKTGRKTIWDDIEVGEIFAWYGCWSIMYKVNKTFAGMVACTDTYGLMDKYPKNNFWIFENGCKDNEGLYRLPLSVQMLWKEE